MEVPYGGNCPSGPLGLDCVAIGSPWGSKGPAVELGLLEVAVSARGWRWRWVVGLRATALLGRHTLVLGHVGSLAGEVGRGLHLDHGLGQRLTSRVIKTVFFR